MSKINLQGTKNTRDLGGIRTQDGYVIKPCRLIRSDKLNELTEADKICLSREYHLKKIIDLRTYEESRQMPDAEIIGVESFFNPLFEKNTLGITHENNYQDDMTALLEGKLEYIPKMEDLYQMLVQNSYSISQMQKVFDILLTDTDGSILWHCTEGKDRCGMVSAFLLYALGVPEEVILEDYLITNDANFIKAETIRSIVLEVSKSEKMADRVASLFLAKEEYLMEVINYMKNEYGSIDMYLEKQLNLTKDKRKRLQELYCE